MDQYKKIPFLGVNTEPLDDQSPDGLCKDIINLRPAGPEEEPYWTVVKDIEKLKSTTGTNFPTSSYTNAFIQVLSSQDASEVNYGDSLKRVLVMVVSTLRLYEDIAGSWTLVDSYVTTDTNFTATRIGNLTVISTSTNEIPGSKFVIKNNKILPMDLPDLPEVEVRWYPRVFTVDEIELGNTKGMPCSKSVQSGSDSETRYNYLKYMIAYELFDGTYVKHSNPRLAVMPRANFDSLGNVYMNLATYLKGYEAIPSNLEFWSEIIKSVSVFITSPKQTKKAIYTEDLYYLASTHENIKTFPTIASNAFMSNPLKYLQTPDINVDTLPTNPSINIDDYTNHKNATVYLDTYNQRTLNGIVSTDFVNPKLAIEGSFTDYDVNYLVGQPYFIGFSKDSIFETIAIAPMTASGSRMANTVVYKSGDFTTDPAFPVDLSSYFYKVLVTDPTPTTNSKLLYQVQVYDGSGGYFIVELDSFMNLDYLMNVIQISGTDLRKPFYEGKFYVKIETDKGDFYREGDLSSEDFFLNEINPSLIQFSYPDIRATELHIYYQETLNGTWKYLKKELKAARLSNYSYFIGQVKYADFQTLSVYIRKDYDKILIEKSEVKASKIGNPFVLDSAATYDVSGRLNSVVKGFATNALETSQGQFGQYPLYIFTTVGIYALEQTGDPEVAFGRLSPISPYHIVDSNNAFTNAERIVLFANKTGIYSLAGNDIQRISDPVFSDGYYDATFSANVVMGFNKATEEVIISNPDVSYSLIYNVRYGKWYKITQTYSNFFYDYPQLLAISNDKLSIKNFDSLKADAVSITLITRPLNLDNAFFLKRLKYSVLRALLSNVNVKLKAHDSQVTYYSAVVGGLKSQDIQIAPHNASAKNFTLEITGETTSVAIHLFEVNYELRYPSRVRLN
jgi:hypothetical protein